MNLQQSFGPMLGQMGAMFGMNMNFNEILPKLEGLLQTTEQIVKEFTDAETTTFIPVLIPEFLQELMNLEMDANTIIVNQILPVNDCCEYCKNKRAIQSKYLGQIDQLYGDFHLIKINMQTREVRGLKELREFGRFLEEQK